MRYITFKKCPVCGRTFQSLGYARHAAKHRDDKNKAAKPALFKAHQPNSSQKN